jgi:prolyl oligopeptidase
MRCGNIAAMRALLSVIAAFSLAAQADSLPVFPASNVPETFFGTVVDDPYRAMENEKDPAVASWMKAHAEHARRTLESLPGYAALAKRIAELDNAAAARIGGVERARNGDFYFTRRGASDNVFKLYVRRADGGETLLADPDDWQRETGKPHAINYFSVAPDSKLVAVGISQGGNELATLYLIDTTTRQRVGEPIDRARYAEVSWADDSKAFFYSRVPALPAGAPVSEIFKNRRAYFHVVGTKADADAFLLGPDGNPKVKVLPTESPSVVATRGSRYAVAVVNNGVQRELTLYAAPIDEAKKADAQWVRICDPADQVTGFAVRGDDIYLRSHASSPRFAILRTKLSAPDVKKAEVVVAPGELLVSEVAAARDGLYYETREGAITRLKRVAWDAKVAHDVRFPVEGATGILSASPDIDGVVASVSAWTRAREIYAVAPDGKVTNTGLQPLGRFDAPTDLVATEVRVKSHDGAMVPLSIVHRKGIKLDGSNPAMLVGYGSYGITYDATFDPVRIAWLEKGGVYAVANVRGSSAYGEDWYKAGYKATKPNTWKDFIACAEYLIARKYTSAKHLGIVGGSAGGITVGRALTSRPDLFAAGVPQVGMLDFVRLQVMPIGPVNVVEFGDIRKEDEFRGLLEMSSYHHVKKGTAYPAVLLQHGVNDTRVNVGQSNKMAAALMAATTSGKPILLDLDYDSGHGQGMTKAQRQHLIAHYYAFLLWQAGHPDFN